MPWNLGHTALAPLARISGKKVRSYWPLSKYLYLISAAYTFHFSTAAPPSLVRKSNATLTDIWLGNGSSPDPAGRSCLSG